MASKKKVACLYRVSTKTQVDGDDIPMQRNACRDFIDRQDDWKLYKEYLEKGVSGYKNTFADRDVLLELQEEARQKNFDVLLVFMFDRLGRLENETPFVVKWFVDNGIEVWSVKEGQRRFDDHIDNLLNYITFWQANGESKKTGIRVKEKHTQMAKEGEFCGGEANYGYQLKLSGKISKTGRSLKKKVIYEPEAKVVRLVYDLSYRLGWGGYKIAVELNSRGIPTKKNSQWSAAVVNYMLRNPIYKGYNAYGKTKQKGKKQGRTNPDNWIVAEEKNEELAIIPEEMWDKIQVMRKARTPGRYKTENIDYESNYPRQTKGSLLFTGFIRCGCCDSTLTTGYYKARWTLKDGTKKNKSRNSYKCTGRSTGNIGCDAPYSYRKEVIEEPVMEEVYKYLDRLEKIDLTKEIEQLKKKNTSGDEKEIKRLKREILKAEGSIEELMNEITKSLRGESVFSPTLLNEQIENEKNNIAEAKVKLERLVRKLETKKIEREDMEELQKLIPVWSEEFEKAPIETKKILLTKIIDNIVVWPDKIQVNMKMNINDFMGVALPQ